MTIADSEGHIYSTNSYSASNEAINSLGTKPLWYLLLVILIYIGNLTHENTSTPQ